MVAIFLKIIDTPESFCVHISPREVNKVNIFIEEE